MPTRAERKKRKDRAEDHCLLLAAALLLLAAGTSRKRGGLRGLWSTWCLGRTVVTSPVPSPQGHTGRQTVVSGVHVV